MDNRVPATPEDEAKRYAVYRCESCGTWLCADDLIAEGTYKNGHVDDRGAAGPIPCGPVSNPFGAELPYD